MSEAPLISRLAEVRGALAVKRHAEALTLRGADAVAAFQQRQFRGLLSTALERSSFYREYYGPGAAHAALTELPVLTKHTLMDNFDDAVTDRRLRLEQLRDHLGGDEELYLGQFRAMATGGSSRVKGVFVFDRRGWSHVTAASLRASELIGLRPRLPRRRRNAFIYAPGLAHMGARIARSIDIGINRTLRLEVTEPVPELAAALNRFKPDAILSYPSMLALLAQEQLAGRLRITPSTVSSSSEARSSEVAGLIEQAWGTRPHDVYALTETAPLAADCGFYGGLHLFEDQAIVEVVDDDGRPVGPGETGARILVTNLFNRVQPLIRFEISDRVRISEEQCACGWPLRTIAAVEGRSDDVLQLPTRGGDPVAVVPFRFGVLTALPGVREFEVVHDPGTLNVRIVVDPAADPTATIAVAHAKVAEILESLSVSPELLRVEACGALARDPGSGKRRVVRSNVEAFGLPRSGQAFP